MCVIMSYAVVKHRRFLQKAYAKHIGTYTKNKDGSIL